MTKIEYLNYDENVDHLTIYKANEKIISNVDTGLVILSLNKKKEIVGMEFMGVNKNFKVPLDVLKNLKNGNVEIKYNPDRKFIIISVVLNYQKKQTPFTFSSNMDLGKNPVNEALLVMPQFR